MKNQDYIISYADYGFIHYDISSIMKKRNLTQTQIVKRTGLHNQIVERYVKGSITRFDKEILAKLCYVLNCELNEIMYYVRPKDNN